jgi:hypothetical protein
MTRKRLVAILLIALSLCSTMASARVVGEFEDGEGGGFVVDAGFLLQLPYELHSPGSPLGVIASRHEVHGNTVDLILDVFAGDFAVSGYYAGSYTLPPLPVGDYTLNLVLTQMGGPAIVRDSTPLRVQVGTLQPGQSIDAMSTLGLLLTTAVLWAFGSAALRRRGDMG